MTTTFDHDIVVIGSGFGGSVSALRLSEKGYDVLVYEAGRRFADEDLPKTSWDVRKYLWAPMLKCYGVQRIHRLPDVTILAGAGVGGGSLNYANTLYVPPEPFFTDRQWAGITDWRAELAPHYTEAKRMLGVVEENPCDGPVEQLMREVAEELGVADSFRKTPAGVFFGTPGIRVADPYFGGAGPERTGCTQCGNCMVGCRVGAKNTLVKNYLWFAERNGVHIEPMRTVVGIEPLDPAAPETGWRVVTERTGSWLRKDRQSVTARHVVLAAGTWGTQQLLHRMKASDTLPRVSDRLGILTRTNSEALGGAAALSVPENVDLCKGVAITTSFHIDHNTHLENVRYGKGSNLMGLMASALQLNGEDKTPRPVQWLTGIAKRPWVSLRTILPTRWSEKTIITLVMQTLDNSLTVKPTKRFGRWQLTSEQGHGAPNPTFLPQGYRAKQVIATRLQALSRLKTVAGSSKPENLGIAMTAHFLGGAVIAEDADHGVIDPYHRVFGYPTLHVVDGSAVSANLGVNPSLTITAQAERAMALWPVKGSDDERPSQGEPYVRLRGTRAGRLVA